MAFHNYCIVAPITFYGIPVKIQSIGCRAALTATILKTIQDKLGTAGDIRMNS